MVAWNANKDVHLLLFLDIHKQEHNVMVEIEIQLTVAS